MGSLSLGKGIESVSVDFVNEDHKNFTIVIILNVSSSCPDPLYVLAVQILVSSVL